MANQSQAVVVQRKLTPSQVRSAIHSMCEKHNYNPFEDIIKLATESQTIEVNGKSLLVRVATPEQRIAIAKEVAQYLAPKLKALETEDDSEEGKEKNSFTLKILQFTQGAEAAIETPVALPAPAANG